MSSSKDNRVSPFFLTRHLTEHNTGKLMKYILYKNIVGLVLQRLDRLTQEEALNTAAQTLEVIYILVQIMAVVMNGEKRHSDCDPPSPEEDFV